MFKENSLIFSLRSNKSDSSPSTREGGFLRQKIYKDITIEFDGKLIVKRRITVATSKVIELTCPFKDKSCSAYCAAFHTHKKKVYCHVGGNDRNFFQIGTLKNEYGI